MTEATLDLRTASTSTPGSGGTLPARPTPGAGYPEHSTVSGERWRDPKLLSCVAALAHRYCARDPDLYHDLYQEGLLEAWLTELREPGSPIPHLVKKARERICDYRHTGRSVDGKLNAAYHRPFVYGVLSLDGQVGPDHSRGPTLHEHVPNREEPLEEMVIGRLAAEDFLGSLPSIDRRMLELRLAGFLWWEVSRITRLSPRATFARLNAVRQLARGHWISEGRELSHPGWRRRSRRRVHPQTGDTRTEG